MAALLATALAHYIKNWLRPLAARDDLPRWPRRFVVAGMVLAPSFLGAAADPRPARAVRQLRPADRAHRHRHGSRHRAGAGALRACTCLSVSLGPEQLDPRLGAANHVRALGDHLLPGARLVRGRRTHARQHRPAPRQDHLQPLGVAQEHRGHRRLPDRHQPDRAHDRTPRHEARRPRDLDAHRHLQVLHVLRCVGLGVLFGINASGVDLTVLDRAHRRHRSRPGLRPAGHRQQFRLRLRAAARQVHQARRRHQLHRHHRHQHRELRLGAGAARPLHRRARPGRRRNAGAEPEPHHQLGDQLELLRPARAHPPAGA